MKQIIMILAAMVAMVVAPADVYGQDAIAKGDAFFNEGKYDDAKRQYMLHKLNSNDRHGHSDARIAQCDECEQLLTIAGFCFSEKDYTKARENYDKVLAINPRDPSATARLQEIQIPEPVISSSLDGVTINGTTWATRDVGAHGRFMDNPWDRGVLYTFYEARTACPMGWRTPTREELVSLMAAKRKTATISGIYGFLIGSENNKLFLSPNRYTTGVRYETSLWSSTTPGRLGYRLLITEERKTIGDSTTDKSNGENTKLLIVTPRQEQLILEAIEKGNLCSVRCVKQ